MIHFNLNKYLSSLILLFKKLLIKYACNKTNIIEIISNLAYPPRSLNGNKTKVGLKIIKKIKILLSLYCAANFKNNKIFIV